MADWSITYIRTILTNCLAWFTRVIAATGVQSLWIGAVIFSAVFSIILLPMRGGAMLGGGMISDMARSKITSRRRNANKHGED